MSLINLFTFYLKTGLGAESEDRARDPFREELIKNNNINCMFFPNGYFYIAFLYYLQTLDV